MARQLAASFAGQRHWDLADMDIRTTTVGDSTISEFEFTEHGDTPTYWQVWHVVGPRRAAFATYTCEPERSHLEAADRQKIIESLEWTEC